MQGYHKYIYDGPVMEFNNLIAEHWKGETMAPSEKKARSNLIYKFKINNNRVASSKITLPGKIIDLTEVQSRKEIKV